MHMFKFYSKSYKYTLFTNKFLNVAPINREHLLCHHLISGDSKETIGDCPDTVSILVNTGDQCVLAGFNMQENFQ